MENKKLKFVQWDGTIKSLCNISWINDIMEKSVVIYNNDRLTIVNSDLNIEIEKGDTIIKLSNNSIVVQKGKYRILEEKRRRNEYINHLKKKIHYTVSDIDENGRPVNENCNNDESKKETKSNKIKENHNELMNKKYRESDPTMTRLIPIEIVPDNIDELLNDIVIKILKNNPDLSPTQSYTNLKNKESNTCCNNNQKCKDGNIKINKPEDIKITNIIHDNLSKKIKFKNF